MEKRLFVGKERGLFGDTGLGHFGLTRNYVRVAYCLSGLMRTYKETLASQLANIIEPNNCDVFISTWDVAGHVRTDKYETKDYNEKVEEKDFRELYGDRLKGLSIFNLDEIRPTFKKCFYEGMIAMFWQIYQCDKLRRQYEDQNGFSYDYIIRSRPDLLFHTGFELTKINSIGPFVWVPNFDNILIDDCLAFGMNDVMSIYSSVYEQIETYHKAKDFYTQHPKYNCICWPEQTLILHLQRSGLPLRSFPIEYQIQRSKDNE